MITDLSFGAQEFRVADPTSWHYLHTLTVTARL